MKNSSVIKEEEKMKKALVILSAITVLAMGTTVYAAGSPTEDKVSINESQTTSPATEDTMSLLPAVAILSAAGLVVCGMKAKRAE